MDKNLIIDGILALEMDPHGIFTGVVGAVLSMWGTPRNELNWRRTGLTLTAGIFLGGYTMPWIESLVINEEDTTRAYALLLNMGVGFIAADVLSSIKTTAPTLTNALMGLLAKWVEAFVERYLKSNKD